MTSNLESGETLGQMITVNILFAFSKNSETFY